MADEGSVAPRERVNIVYRPATGGAQEEVELPLKMLVAGDFTGVPDKRIIEKREPVNIDKDNFNDVLKAHNVKLEFGVADELTGQAENQIPVKLEFNSMADFGPERVAAQIPELQALLDIRNALTALKGPLANVPEFRNKIQSLVKDDDTRSKLLKEMGIAEGENQNG